MEVKAQLRPFSLIAFVYFASSRDQMWRRRQSSWSTPTQQKCAICPAEFLKTPLDTISSFTNTPTKETTWNLLVCLGCLHSSNPPPSFCPCARRTCCTSGAQTLRESPHTLLLLLCPDPQFTNVRTIDPLTSVMCNRRKWFYRGQELSAVQ